MVWDPPSAVVSFQSPVYGGECVDYYVVTALSEEENITCNSTSDKFMFNCTIPSDRSVYDFNFTAYSVTRGDFINGGVATDCCKYSLLFLVTAIVLQTSVDLPSPYNVSVYEEECGLKYCIKWKVKDQKYKWLCRYTQRCILGKSRVPSQHKYCSQQHKLWNSAN